MSKCAFCSDRAFDVCEVPVTGPAIEEVGRLAPGDLLQSPRTLEYVLIRQIVIPKEIEHLDTLDCETDIWPAPVRVTATLGKRRETLLLTPTLPVIVMKTDPCNTPVCECHAIDRGDGRPICPYHWEVTVDRPGGGRRRMTTAQQLWFCRTCQTLGVIRFDPEESRPLADRLQVDHASVAAACAQPDIVPISVNTDELTALTEHCELDFQDPEVKRRPRKKQTP